MSNNEIFPSSIWEVWAVRKEPSLSAESFVFAAASQQHVQLSKGMLE